MAKSLFTKTFVAKVFVVLFVVAAFVLEYIGLLNDVNLFLDSPPFVFEVGNVRLSLYVFLKGSVIIITMFWAASFLSTFLNKRIHRLSLLKPGNKALIEKALQAVLYFFAFFLTLDLLSIDLGALAVFSGAIGIGLGFGLQKITSNFISGFIILFENSIEANDLVELADGTSGFVRQTRARYTLIETFDKQEILVPNEDLITSKVINWTFSDSSGRIDIRFGVSYKSDLKLVRRLALEAAKGHKSCLKDPEPRCFLTEFGDSSVNFVLFIFVDDISSAILQSKSEVMFDIWDKFHEHGVEIPFPQLDVHMKAQ